MAAFARFTPTQAVTTVAILTKKRLILTRQIEENTLKRDQSLRPHCVVDVRCHQSLSVERRPAQEKGHHHSHCRQYTSVITGCNACTIKEEVQTLT